MKRAREKGSFTIEAAIIVPFFLFLMMTILQMGIGFYQESASHTKLHKWDGFQAVSMFYRMQLLEDIGEEVLERE